MSTEEQGKARLAPIEPREICAVLAKGALRPERLAMYRADGDPDTIVLMAFYEANSTGEGACPVCMALSSEDAHAFAKELLKMAEVH